MVDNIFLQISALLAITVAIAFFVRLLRQPLIIAYIIAGITAGPLFFNILSAERDVYEAFAQFGVVLLLFIIGLNLNFSHLKSIGRVSFITGMGQVIFTSVVGLIILLALGLPMTTAIYLAVAITFSSTIIIMKLLADKGETETVYGRHTIGLMLVQDIIAVSIMVAIGILRSETDLGGSLVRLAINGVVSLATIFLISKYVIPKFLTKVSSSTELLFIFTVSWCFSVASLFYLMGFSLEIGAIMAGISLSASPYQPEIASRIKPLRDFFLIIFFIVLGGQLSLSAFSAVWLPGLALAVFILIGNPLILYFLFRSLKFTRRNSFLAGLTAAQVSEFGFVMLFTGQQIGHLSGNEVPIFTLVAIVTIFISSYLILYSEKIYTFMLPFFNLFGPDKYRQTEHQVTTFDVWVVGYHRIGKKVSQALKELKTKFAVIDFDPAAIHDLNANNIPSVFGDIADIEFLEALPLVKSRLIIMTAPSVDDQINLIKYLRKHNSPALIIANGGHHKEGETLYSAGADYVMMPHLLGGDWIASLLKDNRRLSRRLFTDLKKEQSLLMGINLN